MLHEKFCDSSAKFETIFAVDLYIGRRQWIAVEDRKRLDSCGEARFFRELDRLFIGFRNKCWDLLFLLVILNREVKSRGKVGCGQRSYFWSKR